MASLSQDPPLTASECADELRMSRRAFDRLWHREPLLKPVNLGRRLHRWYPSQLERFKQIKLAEAATAPAPPKPAAPGRPWPVRPRRGQ